jgi:hypothetical protein
MFQLYRKLHELWDEESIDRCNGKNIISGIRSNAMRAIWQLKNPRIKGIRNLDTWGGFRGLGARARVSGVRLVVDS